MRRPILSRSPHSRSPVGLVVGALFLTALVSGCSEPFSSPTPLAGASNTAADSIGSVSAQSAKGGGGTKPKYTLAFSGDITGLKESVSLNPNAPWRGLDVDNMTITLPPSDDLAGCGFDETNWGGNAATWDGGLSIRERGDFTHLGFRGSSGTLKDLNLAINHDAVSSGTGTTIDAFVLTFTNAQALVGATSQDSDADPCVTFTITATPQ